MQHKRIASKQTTFKQEALIEPELKEAKLIEPKLIDPKKAVVEIELATLMRLLKNKHIFASEMRYLNGQSKHLVRKLCLQTCTMKNTKRL